MAQRHEKAYRLIAGALLGSNLTRRELIEFSDRLMFDSRWTERLALYLREIAEISGMYGLKSKSYVGLGQRDVREDFVQEIVELFRRRRLPKREVLVILREVSNSKRWEPDLNRTVRENSVALIETLRGPEEAGSLVNRIAHRLGHVEDPYLREL